MPVATTWDPDTPLGTDFANTIDDHMRSTKKAIEERLAEEHYFGTSFALDGKHKNVTSPDANLGDDSPGRQHLIGRNEAQNGAAGTLALVDMNGGRWYYWTDNDGKLRRHTSPPVSNDPATDLLGLVVGGLGDVTYNIEGDDINFNVTVDAVNQIVTYNVKNPVDYSLHSRLEWHATRSNTQPTSDHIGIATFPTGSIGHISQGGISSTEYRFPDGLYLKFVGTAPALGGQVVIQNQKAVLDFMWDFDITWVIRTDDITKIDLLGFGIGHSFGPNELPTSGDAFLWNWENGTWRPTVVADGAAFSVDSGVLVKSNTRYVLRIRRIAGRAQYWLNGSGPIVIHASGGIIFPDGPKATQPALRVRNIDADAEGDARGGVFFSRMWCDYGERGVVFPVV